MPISSPKPYFYKKVLQTVFMDIKKVVLILAALALVALAIYGFFLGGTSALAAFFISETDDNVENIEDTAEDTIVDADVDIQTVMARGDSYEIRIQNTGNSEIDLSEIRVTSDGEDISNQIEYDEEVIGEGDTSSADTNIETGEDTTFEIESNGKLLSEYSCSYIEGSTTC